MMLRELRTLEEVVARFDQAEALESDERRAYFRLYPVDCPSCLATSKRCAPIARLSEDFRLAGRPGGPGRATSAKSPSCWSAACAVSGRPRSGARGKAELHARMTRPANGYCGMEVLSDLPRADQ